MKRNMIILIIAAAFAVILGKPAEIESVEMFENVLKQPNKLLVFDLYADWCRPCKMLDPILTEISDSTAAVQFYRVNIDNLKPIQQAFQATSIPFVAFFKNGEYLDRLIGLYPKETYEKAIEILDK